MKICDARPAAAAPPGCPTTPSSSPRAPTARSMRVPAAGGEPKPLTELDAAKGEQTHRWPAALPDGKHVLFTAHTLQSGFDSATIEVVSVDTGERKTLAQRRLVRALRPERPPGVRQRRHAVRRAVRPGQARAHREPGSGAAGGRRVARRGRRSVRLLRERPARLRRRQLAGRRLSDRLGRPPGRDQPAPARARRLRQPASSRRTSSRLALTVMRGDNWDVWVYDLERGVSTRLTFDKSIESEQIWSPDGQWLILSSDQDGPDSLYRKRADGSGELERLTEAKTPQWAGSWSRDGRYVAYITQGAAVRPRLSRPRDARRPTPSSPPSSAKASPTSRPTAAGWPTARTSRVAARRSTCGRSRAARASGRCRTWARSHPRWSGERQAALLAHRRRHHGRRRRDRRRHVPGRQGAPALLRAVPGRTDRESRSLGLQFDDYDVTADGQRFVMFPDRAEGGTRRPCARHPGDATGSTTSSGRPRPSK